VSSMAVAAVIPRVQKCHAQYCIAEAEQQLTGRGDLVQVGWDSAAQLRRLSTWRCS
jgi:aryl carrier-like protein